jgi:hypothetical protein
MLASMESGCYWSAGVKRFVSTATGLAVALMFNSATDDDAVIESVRGSNEIIVMQIYIILMFAYDQRMANYPN